MRLNTADYFWSGVDIPDGDNDVCWNWTRACVPQGYGRFRFMGKQWRAHRVAWVLEFGDIPDRLMVLHRCDNPPCCNPAHLFLGTGSDNAKDCASKGRNIWQRHPEMWVQGHCPPERRRRGEAHPSAKLNEKKVLEIRERFSAGGVTYRGLGREYGVSNIQIRNVVKGRSWVS
jgi:hypothetical protein